MSEVPEWATGVISCKKCHEEKCDPKLAAFICESDFVLCCDVHKIEVFAIPLTEEVSDFVSGCGVCGKRCQEHEPK